MRPPTAAAAGSLKRRLAGEDPKSVAPIAKMSLRGELPVVAISGARVGPGAVPRGEPVVVHDDERARRGELDAADRDDATLRFAGVHRLYSSMLDRLDALPAPQCGFTRM